MSRPYFYPGLKNVLIFFFFNYYLDKSMAAPPKKYEKNIIAFFGPSFCRTSKKKVFLKRSLRAAFINFIFEGFLIQRNSHLLCRLPIIVTRLNLHFFLGFQRVKKRA